MKRRSFLNATALAAVAVAWPAWLRSAFADDKSCNPGGQLPVAVASAFQSAQRAGKRLLVMVIPADEPERWERGHVFGELLNHGSDDDLAPLSDVVVVCATMDDVRKIVPGAGDVEPLLLLVETHRLGGAVKALQAKIPDYPQIDEWGPAGEKKEAAVTDQRIGVLGKLLRDGLGEGRGDRAERAASVRKRLMVKPPAGARWASSHGCGVAYEDPKDGGSMVLCGMGHVPAKSARFLDFLTAPKRK